MKRILLILTLLTAAPTAGTAAPPQADSSRQRILLIEVDGVINPVSTEYILSHLDRAEKENFHALILQLDTPGGLLESTRIITKRILGAEVPVIVYVAPSGARAASAGVFICYSAHLVAMAPSTNIGAAHPVTMGAGADSTQQTMIEKVTNDAVARIKGMANKRGRNAEWAEKAIRESVSITAEEALKKNVINFIAPTLDSLLALLDGREVEVVSGTVKLHTRNAVIVRSPMSWRDRILDRLSDPNIAYILLLLGIYGIFFELSNPGAIFPGVVGAIFLILAFYSMQTLPVNYAGLLLILLALILFILEVKITSYGLLTIGGIISMILGSLMLFESPDELGNPIFKVSLKLILTFTAATAAFFLFALTMAFRTHRRKVTTGKEGLIGEVGRARSNIDPEGRVQVHGEIWSAYADEPIEAGERVRVVAVDGMQVKVEKVR